MTVLTSDSIVNCNFELAAGTQLMNISILAFSIANKERKEFFVLRNAQKPNESNTIEYQLDCKETQQLQLY